jgi:hypothetical protein
MENTRMYCGPSGMMMMKSTIVVNWMAARESNSNRSANGLRGAPSEEVSVLKAGVR